MRPVDIPWPEAVSTGWRWCGSYRYCSPLLDGHDGTCHCQEMPTHLMWCGMVDGEPQAAMRPEDDEGDALYYVVACGAVLADTFQVLAAAQSEGGVCELCFELLMRDRVEEVAS